MAKFEPMTPKDLVMEDAYNTYTYQQYGEYFEDIDLLRAGEVSHQAWCEKRIASIALHGHGSSMKYIRLRPIEAHEMNNAISNMTQEREN